MNKEKHPENKGIRNKITVKVKGFNIMVPILEFDLKHDLKYEHFIKEPISEGQMVEMTI